MSDQRLDIEGFTEEERREIFNQIEELSRRSSITVDRKTFEYTPRKKGGTFPLMVNLIALLTIAGVILFSYRFFQNREAALSAEAKSYLTTEGKLLEELKKESDRRLGEKEQEISRIQQELSQIDQERAALESTMEERIQEKESELQSALQAAIEEERQRLRGLGITAEEVEQQVEAFRREQESRYDEQLQQYRRESQEALSQKQQELEAAKTLAEQILNQATSEREELLAENRQREEELRSRFEEQRQSLEAATSEARQQLQALAEARQNEQLMMDQITSAYRTTLDAIQAGDGVLASAELEKLKTLLNSETADALASVRSRRPVDLYLADLLQDRIRSMGSAEAEGPDTGLIEAAQKLLSARQAAALGDQAAEEGRVNDAAASYEQALQLVPAVKRAADELTRLRGEARAERAREYRALAEEAIAAGNRDEGTGQLEAALLESASASDATRLAAAEALDRMSALTDAELEEVEDRAGALSSAASDLQARLEESGKAVQELNGRLSALEKERDALREEIASLAGSEEELEARNGELSQQLAEAKSEAERAAAEVERLENELAAANEATESLGKDLATQRQELFAARSNLERSREQAEALQADLDEAVDQLASIVSLSESNRTLRQAVSRYQELGAGQAQSPEEADSRLRQLLESGEIRALFPGINELLDTSSLGAD